MPFLSNDVSQRALRRFVVWLLAALLPVQGMAAALLATVGPLHTHRMLVGASAMPLGASSERAGASGAGALSGVDFARDRSAGAPVSSRRDRAASGHPDAATLLVDFRRASRSTAPHATHASAWFGHVHATEQPLRHLHAPGDASLVTVAGDPSASGADPDDGATAVSLACWVALPSEAMATPGSGPDGARASAAPWSWRPHAPLPPEHPPRIA